MNIIKTLISCITLCMLSILSACQPVKEETVSSNESSMGFSQQFGQAVNKDQGLNFPEDHGAHHEQGIEWWYVTANLEAQDGQTFGVQWTLFRLTVEEQTPLNSQSAWWNGQLYFAHFVIQTDTQHHAFEKYARAGQVDIQAQPFIARLDDWQLSSKSQSFLPLNLKAQQPGYSANLVLSNSPLVKHGEQGYSQKTHQGHASYYYSYPFLQVQGDIEFANKTYKVTGNAWLDREWSSGLIDASKSGWDWFSIQADDKSLGGLMAFCIRNNQQQYDYCSASHITREGQVTAMANNDVNMQVLNTQSFSADSSSFSSAYKNKPKTYPIKWALDIKGFETIIVEANNPDSRNQLSIAYWEGRVKTTGGFVGKGFAELVGY
ncbi:MAG: putative secreted hydrolase [Oleispira sp.]|jgi:predicted secreted hydrolase